MTEMATRDVSISISADGEQQFAQAMRNAQSAMKVFNSELKASEAAYQENGDAQAFLSQKSKILEAQLEQNKTIVQAYERAIEDLSKAYGETDARIDKYRIALNKANEAGSKMAKALRETQQEAEELGRDSERVGRQIESGIGDAAEETSEQLDEMIKDINDGLDSINQRVGISAAIDTGRAVFDAGKTVYDTVKGTADAIGQIVEETEDYRRSMSFLEQNALNFGFDPEYIKEQLFNIQSLTGDMDGAFEGLSNLMAAGFDGKELEEAIDLIGGAVIRFPETMKFENLAESLQESVASGAATGAYAELLERLGIDLETVNASLEAATTAEERQQVALAYLNENGLEETVQNYRNLNADLIESERAQSEYNDALAGLGDTLSPLATRFTNFKTSVVNGITDLLQSEDMSAWTDKLSGALDGMAAYIDSDAWKETLSDLGTKLDEAFAQIGEWMNTDGLAAGVEGIKGIMSGLQDDLDAQLANVKTIGSNIATTIGNGITEARDNAINAASNLWNSIKSVLSQTIAIPKPEFNAETYNGTGRTTASSYAAGGQNNTIQVITQIDGETVGNATASSVGNNLGAQAQRASTYNR